MFDVDGLVDDGGSNLIWDRFELRKRFLDGLDATKDSETDSSDSAPELDMRATVVRRWREVGWMLTCCNAS